VKAAKATSPTSTWPMPGCTRTWPTGDQVSTGHFDVNERYRAAVGVFSHMAVVAIETLHYINHLVELGVIELPVGTFSDPVIVTEFVTEGLLYESEVGADLGDSETGGPIPDHLRPAFELTQQLFEQRSGGEQPPDG
jgi:hypothetical protein